jgi:hypothetical protein
MNYNCFDRQGKVQEKEKEMTMTRFARFVQDRFPTHHHLPYCLIQKAIWENREAVHSIGIGPQSGLYVESPLQLILLVLEMRKWLQMNGLFGSYVLLYGDGENRKLEKLLSEPYPRPGSPPTLRVRDRVMEIDAILEVMETEELHDTTDLYLLYLDPYSMKNVLNPGAVRASTMDDGCDSSTRNVGAD